jgi:hypothetical protein
MFSALVSYSPNTPECMFSALVFLRSFARIKLTIGKRLACRSRDINWVKRSLINKLGYLWLCVVASIGLTMVGRGQGVTISVPFELASDSFELREAIFDGQNYSEAIRPFTFVTVDSAAIVYGVSFDFSAGGLLTLTNLTMGVEMSGSASPEQMLTFSQWDFISGNLIQPAFAIPEDRIDHVFALWKPAAGLIYPITKNGVAGIQQGSNWQSLGFFTARCMTPFAVFSPEAFRLVDLTNNEAAGVSVTNTLGGSWEYVGGQLPTVAVSAYVSDASGSYALHTSGGSIQNAPVIYSVDGFYVTGQVGVGESFWFTRDVDGASSPTFFCNGDPWFDLRPYISQYVSRYLVTHGFQIGQEYFGYSLAIVHPDGFITGLTQDTSESWIQGWDDYGQPTQYSYRGAIGEVDLNQSGWSLVDTSTWENFGQTTTLGSGYYMEHPSAPSFIPLTLRGNRAANSLWLVQDNAEEWAVTVDQGSHGMMTGSFMGQNYEIPFVLATAPHLPEFGFHFRDDTVGDTSGSLSSGTTQADLATWYLPPIATPLFIHESRWNNVLFLMQPATNQRSVVKGQVQGVWMPGNGGTVFTSLGFYDAHTERHPDTIWVLWDSTRNEVLNPDPGTTSDFLLASDDTDTDGDGVPDWWELKNGFNPNDPTDGGGLDTDGDGVLDRDEFDFGTNLLQKDNPAVQLTISGFVTP